MKKLFLNRVKSKIIMLLIFKNAGLQKARHCLISWTKPHITLFPFVSFIIGYPTEAMNFSFIAISHMKTVTCAQPEKIRFNQLSCFNECYLGLIAFNGVKSCKGRDEFYCRHDCIMYHLNQIRYYFRMLYFMLKTKIME